jgi:hypothetical protein
MDSTNEMKALIMSGQDIVCGKNKLGMWGIGNKPDSFFVAKNFNSKKAVIFTTDNFEEALLEFIGISY